jgi:hypothetical protein
MEAIILAAKFPASRELTGKMLIFDRSLAG